MALALGVAGCLGACTSGGGSSEGADETTTQRQASGGEQPTQVPAPADVAAAAAPFRVVLTWSLPAGGSAERFGLFRDSEPLATVSGSVTTFEDTSTLPGEEYAYEIEAQAGDVVSERVLVTAKTPMPPLRNARLAGSFNVKGKVVSRSGYGSYEKPVLGWTFKPQCVEGACDVMWRDLHMKRVRSRLNQRGARYHGTYTGPYLIECSGTPSTSSVTLDVRVKTARVVQGKWRATSIVGTMAHSEVAQLGCAAAQARLTIRGRLVG